MRSGAGTRRHSRNALSAPSPAAATSAADDSGSSAICSPVPGFTTGRHSAAFEGTHSPLM